MYARVNPRFYWYVAGHDSDTSTVHLEAEDTTTGEKDTTTGTVTALIGYYYS